MRHVKPETPAPGTTPDTAMVAKPGSNPPVNFASVTSNGGRFDGLGPTGERTFIEYDPMRPETQPGMNSPYANVDNGVVKEKIRTNGLLLLYTATNAEENSKVHTR